MDLVATAALSAPRERVVAAVGDLGTYPGWLRIVLDAVPAGEATWLVDIGAKVGPLRRSKRLRMKRTVVDGCHVRFERTEGDGRDHSPWVLDAIARVDGPGTELEMRLRYGGSKWLPLLDRVLAEEIRRAPRQLDRYLRDH